MAMEDDQELKSDLASLLEVNRLDYRLPPSLSIATSRSMKTFRSSKQDHIAGESQVDFQLSSGAAYVDLLNSYLSFDIKIEGSGNPPSSINDVYMPAHAGWLNFIKGYRIVHSSGVELDRQNDAVGEWTQIQNYYHRSKENRRTKGALYRFNDSINPVPINEQSGYWDTRFENLNPNGGASVYAIDNETNGKVYRAVIPLQLLAGIFDQDLLAPSFLTAGLRIELQFYSKEHFFVKKVIPWAVGDTVTISNPEINLECFQLTDSIVRKLSQISASSGLEWYWDATHHMSSVQSSSHVTVQVTRALSRANNIIVKTRHDTALNRREYDSLASQPWVHDISTVLADAPGIALERGNNGTLKVFQVQLGAQYIPSQPITKPEDFLHSALKTFSQFRRSDEVGGVTFPTFTGVKIAQTALAVPATYLPGLAIAALPLESSSTLQQSGSAISAQRTAVVNLEWEDAVAQLGTIVGVNRRIDVFVTYSKLATLFLDSVVVRS